MPPPVPRPRSQRRHPSRKQPAGRHHLGRRPPSATTPTGCTRRSEPDLRGRLVRGRVHGPANGPRQRRPRRGQPGHSSGRCGQLRGRQPRAAPGRLRPASAASRRPRSIPAQHFIPAHSTPPDANRVRRPPGGRRRGSGISAGPARPIRSGATGGSGTSWPRVPRRQPPSAGNSRATARPGAGKRSTRQRPACQGTAAQGRTFAPNHPGKPILIAATSPASATCLLGINLLGGTARLVNGTGHQ
jgi:hypothetical protein